MFSEGNKSTYTQNHMIKNGEPTCYCCRFSPTGLPIYTSRSDLASESTNPNHLLWEVQCILEPGGDGARAPEDLVVVAALGRHVSKTG